MKVIINADDCGRSQNIDNEIIELFSKRLISSTSIMANGDDINRVKSIYDTFKNQASFGVHITLDTLEPLYFSDILLENGYYINQNGKWLLDIDKYRNTIPKKIIRKEIVKEIMAQINSIRDLGIGISHLDSHHHVHASLLGLSILGDIIELSGVKRIRRMRNLCCNNLWIRNAWMSYVSFLTSAKSTDYFCGFEEFMKSDFSSLKKSITIELMCHPGDYRLSHENNLIKTGALFKAFNYDLISYNQLSF